MTEEHPGETPGVTPEAPPPTDTPAPDSPEADVPPEGAPPETGDIVIDAALTDLAAAPEDDLDAQLEAGEAVHRTLQSRLSDLGG